MPPLPDEIVEEIYLRLPPDEPACLVRASLASKLWLGILTGPRFTARYCDFHGAPPMLGFCRFRDNLPDPAKPYFSTTRFGPRIPEDKGRGSSNYGVYDCRHGRLLLKRGHNKPTPTPLFLWDPMTGRWREMHAELCVYNAAVLCAVTGCDHRACHKGPSAAAAEQSKRFRSESERQREKSGATQLTPRGQRPASSRGSMSSSCLRRAAVPVKRVWLGLRARLGRRRSGLGELTREVRTCEYDDVHVMWELLSGMDGSAPRKYVYVPDSGALAAAAAASSIGKKRRRRRRRADAESAAWSRLFSSCCAF